MASTRSPCLAPIGQAVHQPALYDFVSAIFLLLVLMRLRRTFRMVVAVVSEPPVPEPSPLQSRLTRVDNTREGAFGPSWGTMVRSIRTEVVA